MAKKKTVQYIKNEVAERGTCIVNQSVVEAVLGQQYPDDDDYESAVQSMVAQKNWLTDCTIIWNRDMVRLNGPIVPPPPPEW